MWLRTIVFCAVFFVRTVDPPSLGAGRNLDILLWHRDARFFVLSFLTVQFRLGPVMRVVALVKVLAFSSTHSRPAPPLAGDMVVFVDVFPVPYG